MGVDQVTVQNLDIVKVDAELNLIAIRGAVPGPKGSIVYIKDTVKTQPVKKGEGAGISLNPQKASRACQSRRRLPHAPSKERRAA